MRRTSSCAQCVESSDTHQPPLTTTRPTSRVRVSVLTSSGSVGQSVRAARPPAVRAIQQPLKTQGFSAPLKTWSTSAHLDTVGCAGVHESLGRPAGGHRGLDSPNAKAHGGGVWDSGGYHWRVLGFATCQSTALDGWLEKPRAQKVGSSHSTVKARGKRAAKASGHVSTFQKSLNET